MMGKLKTILGAATLTLVTLISTPKLTHANTEITLKERFKKIEEHEKKQNPLELKLQRKYRYEFQYKTELFFHRFNQLLQQEVKKEKHKSVENLYTLRLIEKKMQDHHLYIGNFELTEAEKEKAKSIIKVSSEEAFDKMFPYYPTAYSLKKRIESLFSPKIQINLSRDVNLKTEGKTDSLGKYIESGETREEKRQEESPSLITIKKSKVSKRVIDLGLNNLLNPYVYLTGRNFYFDKIRVTYDIGDDLGISFDKRLKPKLHLNIGLSNSEATQGFEDRSKANVKLSYSLNKYGIIELIGNSNFDKDQSVRIQYTLVSL